MYHLSSGLEACETKPQPCSVDQQISFPNCCTTCNMVKDRAVHRPHLSLPLAWPSPDLVTHYYSLMVCYR
jgi:hypothetical protein